MRALLLAALSLAAGCAHRPTGPLQTVPESARDEARALQRTAYGEQAAALPESAELAKVVLGGVPEASRSRVVHDPQLDRVAALVAKVLLDEQRELAEKVVEELVWHAGVAAEYRGADRAVFTGNDGEEFFTKHLTTVNWPEKGTAVFGVARVGGWQTAQVIIVAARELALDRVPRSVNAGEKFVFEGRVEVEVEDVKVLVEDGPRRVRSAPVQVSTDRRFRVEIDGAAAAGRTMVEFTGIDDRGWQTSLLAIPIYVGKPAPVDPDVPLESPVANPPDVAQWAQSVFAKLNAARAQEKLPALTTHPATETLAQAEAQRAAVNPDSPPVELFTELSRAGMRTRNAFEYRGVTFNLSSRVEHALSRPSVREVLMSPEMTKLGIAFAPRQGGGYADAWILSESLDKFDAQQLTATLRRELNKRRTSRRVNELGADAKLDAIAQAYAEKECAKTPDARAFLDGELRKLSGFTVTRFQILTSPVLHAGSLRGAFSDSQTAQNLLTPGTHAGIGTCERGQPGANDNELTVILFAEAQQRRR